MSVKPVLQPGPNHPITIEPSGSRIVVTVAGQIIADSFDALRLLEASYPPVLYIPLKDVNVELLERSAHTSYCPFKGDASYYSIPAGGDKSVDAVWVYEGPHPRGRRDQGSRGVLSRPGGHHHGRIDRLTAAHTVVRIAWIR